jgi:thiamine biosynthesis protein ThiI
MEIFFLAKYHEIALKGKNRPMFQRALLQSIRGSTRGLGVRQILHRNSRIIIDLEPQADVNSIGARLKEVFGLANFALAYRLPADLGAIKEALGNSLPLNGGIRTFRVRAARADKKFPMISPEIQRDIGAFIQEYTGWDVNLSQADLTVHVEIVPNEAYLFYDQQKGAGGLPSGVSGKVVCLLSGGIDSPVAAYRMMRRGAQVIFVHFHAFPVLWGISRDKVKSILEIINRFQLRSRLYLIPFAPIQQRLLLSVPPRYRVVVYRRLMLGITEVIASQEKAGALVTGESLGQVSSQTLQNLITIDAAVNMPVLRPLIGMDKAEIIEQSQGIGTFDISIQPDEDCCTLFVPSSPITRSTPKEMDGIERNLDWSDLIRMGVETAEIRDYTFDPLKELPRIVRVNNRSGISV